MAGCSAEVWTWGLRCREVLPEVKGQPGPWKTLAKSSRLRVRVKQQQPGNLEVGSWLTTSWRLESKHGTNSHHWPPPQCQEFRGFCARASHHDSNVTDTFLLDHHGMASTAVPSQISRRSPLLNISSPRGLVRYQPPCRAAAALIRTYLGRYLANPRCIDEEARPRRPRHMRSDMAHTTST